MKMKFASQKSLQPEWCTYMWADNQANTTKLMGETRLKMKRLVTVGVQFGKNAVDRNF
jgi:hypothetical protein